MRASRSILPALALLAVLPSCGGDDGGSGSLPTTLCSPDEETCLGNYAATCAPDGRSYSLLTPCHPDRSCSGGACVDRDCTPGRKWCAGIDVTALCSADGLLQTTVPCSVPMESCFGGRCLPDACDPARDAAFCEFDTLVVCDGGARKEEPCPVGTACVDGACKAKEDCTPQEARCSGEAAAGTCNANATGWDVTVCTSKQRCSNGFCLARLADLPGGNGGEDALDAASEP